MRPRPLAAIVVLSCALGLLLAPGVSAVPDAANKARLDATVRFLQDVQNLDGGFGGIRGGASDPTFSAWVGMALAAAGINPRDQRKPGGRSVWDYVLRGSTYEYTTDIERVMLLVAAAGGDPRSFGGRDLVAMTLDRQLSDGSFPHIAGGAEGGVNDTVFAILPLSTLQHARPAGRIQSAARWLLAVQERNGGWGYAAGTDISSDMTGAAIQALRRAGLRDTAAERRAWGYLRSTQNADGGFGYKPAESESNAASTAWVVQALWAAGRNPERWSVGGRSPLDYLASLQQPDGSVRWTAARDVNPIWMTAYAAPAFAGHPLPIPAAPRAAARDSNPEQGVHRVRSHAAPLGRGHGDGGTSAEDGGTVIAGGGGNGAPLFSQPQAQSQGSTPGGERDTDSAGSGPRSPDDGDGGESPARAVEGTVVAGPEGKAAPGLRSSKAGSDSGERLALAVAVCVLLAALLGSVVQRRRPRIAL